MTEIKTTNKGLYKIAVGILIGAGLGLILFAGAGILQNRNVESSVRNGAMDSVPSVGKPAPDFELMNIEGEIVKLSDLRGMVVGINFWATWCAPCVYEMPMFQEMYEEYSPDLEILAVNNQESEEVVLPFIKEMNLAYEILYDMDAQVALNFQVIGFPTTYFVDREGVIRAVHVGVMNEDQFRGYMDELGKAQ
ncbi:MAG: TlpA family protein disulfide reductase [Anaerolineales bacterium]